MMRYENDQEARKLLNLFINRKRILIGHFMRRRYLLVIYITIGIIRFQMMDRKKYVENKRLAQDMIKWKSAVYQDLSQWQNTKNE